MSELKAFNSERIYWAVEQVERVAGWKEMKANLHGADLSWADLSGEAEEY